MKHITKDARGIITGIFRCPQAFPTEEVADLPDNADCGWWKPNGTWQPSDELQATEAAAAARAVKLNNVKTSVATLRAWATDAESATAAWDGWTQAQKNAAMKTVISRLGVFFSRFADLIEGRNIDK